MDAFLLNEIIECYNYRYGKKNPNKTTHKIWNVCGNCDRADEAENVCVRVFPLESLTYPSVGIFMCVVHMWYTIIGDERRNALLFSTYA